MQVTETVNEGLKREFKVVVPAADLASKADERLVQLKDQVRLNGFRPGKVPVAHLKRLYGKSAMAESIETVMRETNAKIVTDRGFKLTREPEITMPIEQAEVEKVIEGKADLSYTMAIEIMPAIELADFKGLTLERMVAEVSDDEVEESLKRITEENKPFAPKGEGAKAEDGDRVMVDFTGKIGGEPFEGGTGGDVGVVIGSNTFIPGFEEQLKGIAAGESRVVTVTFPETYPAENLAGKEAEFDVVAKSVDTPQAVTLDDEFAKQLGLESLDKLKELVKSRLDQEHAGMTRQRIKRQILDQLDKTHQFTAPPSLVEDEFNNVWQSIKAELEQQRRTFADENTTEDKAREEYRTIAERRVRLGLVIAEIGERNNIKVSDEELTRAVMDRARQVPGREQELWNYYRNNPNAVAALRAPIFEDKVIDYIVELATVTDKTVSREELYKDDEAPAA